MENFLTQTGYNHLWTTSINIRCFHGFILELSINIIVKQNSIYLPSYGYFWAAASIKNSFYHFKMKLLGKIPHIITTISKETKLNLIYIIISIIWETVFAKWTPLLDFKNLNQELRNIHLKSAHFFCTLNNLFSSCN